MIAGLLVILACQLAGEFLVRLFGVPVPGPVVGMVLLLGLLLWRRPAPSGTVGRASVALLRHLPVMFVPAGVGVWQYVAVIGAGALPIAVGLVGSWLVALLVTAGTASAVLGLTARRKPEVAG